MSDFTLGQVAVILLFGMVMFVAGILTGEE